MRSGAEQSLVVEWHRCGDWQYVGSDTDRVRCGRRFGDGTLCDATYAEIPMTAQRSWAYAPATTTRISTTP